MKKLTKTVVDKAEIREKPYTIWCEATPGFGVYVLPSGRRSYFVDYRNAQGVRRRMTIGRHGAITTDEARKLAIETLGGIVLQKQDPLQERRTQRKALTVAQLCDRYMRDAEAGLVQGKGGKAKKASTLEIDRGRIDRHIKPLLGSKKVVDLTGADIRDFIRDVSAGKTAMKGRVGKNYARVEVTGGSGTASRTAGFLGGILSYAVAHEIIDRNPAAGIKRPSGTSRTRHLSPDEYLALGNALREAEAEHDTPQAIAGAWLLALTGCRLGEIVNLEWSEVDEAGGCFRLSDSKEGATIRPIGKPAFEVLQKIVRISANPHVLPGHRHRAPFVGLAGAWVRLVKRAGLEGVTPHTMRHSFASVAARCGYSELVIAALLGHRAGTVTSKYVHHLDETLIAAADKVAAEIKRQMGSRP